LNYLYKQNKKLKIGIIATEQNKNSFEEYLPNIFILSKEGLSVVIMNRLERASA
jgi:hypothetical protein